MKISTFRLFILILALVAIAGVFASIGIFEEDPAKPNLSGTDTSTCQHEYEKEVLQSGSCTVDEIYEMVCKKCNDTKAYKLSAKGHTWVDYDSYSECSVCEKYCGHFAIYYGDTISDGCKRITPCVCTDCFRTIRNVVSYIHSDSNLDELCDRCNMDVSSVCEHFWGGEYATNTLCSSSVKKECLNCHEIYVVQHSERHPDYNSDGVCDKCGIKSSCSKHEKDITGKCTICYFDEDEAVG